MPLNFFSIASLCQCCSHHPCMTHIFLSLASLYATAISFRSVGKSFLSHSHLMSPLLLLPVAHNCTASPLKHLTTPLRFPSGALLEYFLPQSSYDATASPHTISLRPFAIFLEASRPQCFFHHHDAKSPPLPFHYASAFFLRSVNTTMGIPIYLMTLHFSSGGSLRKAAAAMHSCCYS